MALQHIIVICIHILLTKFNSNKLNAKSHNMGDLQQVSKTSVLWLTSFFPLVLNIMFCVPANESNTSPVLVCLVDNFMRTHKVDILTLKVHHLHIHAVSKSTKFRGCMAIHL